MSVFWHEENYCIVVTQSEKEKKKDMPKLTSAIKKWIINSN